MYVCVCVCVCVFMCMYVCKLIYCECFFRLQDVWDIHKSYGSTMLCCEYHSRCFCKIQETCVSVCVCVCVYVCVCKLIYCGCFFRLQDVWDIHKSYGSTMLCCEYHSRCFCQLPSSPFLKMSYISPPKTKTREHKLERRLNYIWFRKRWYIFIKDISRPSIKPEVTKRY